MIRPTLLAVSVLAFALSMAALPSLAGSLYSAQNVRGFLSDADSLPETDSLSPTHPDYPVLMVAKALRLENEGKSKAVIALLEPVLIHAHFDPLSTHVPNSTQSQLWVGTVGSYEIWRETIYLLLGRAYYANKQDERALLFLNAIPETSDFAVLAKIESGWAMLRMESKEAADANLKKLEGLLSKATPQEASEVQLQRSFYYLETGALDNAIASAEKLNFTPQSPLSVLRLKVLAQSYIQVYLSRANTAPFQEKRALLEKTLKFAEAIPAAQRDVDFSFLVGETYWHLASLLRIEDPVKLRDSWVASLRKADEWLKPWVEKSIEAKKPLFNEDAFFLSAAVLWEQERKDQAVPRLLALQQFFPRGEYREDANQLLGDHYYDAGEYDQALRFYGELARVGNEEKAAYGVYKAAWAFYNQQEKFKALRHLERLLMHNKAALAKDEPLPNGGLLKEAQKDMILILAEMLPNAQAIKELEIFGYNPARKLEVKEQLASIYKDIGRYEDSISVYQALLTEAPRTKNSFKWLSDIMSSLLSAERRDLLARYLDQYYGSVPAPSSEEFKKEHLALQKHLVNVNLTIHREAKKTEDANIWAATDAMYKSMAAHYPNLSDGEFWYFGAQRKEMLGKKAEAIAWFQKSAMDKSSPTASDSALSVLRLARELSDSTDPKNGQINYQQLAQSVQWYLDNYKKTPQKKVAEFLMMDLYVRAKDFKGAQDYLARAIQEDGVTQDHQDQYFNLNRKLYEASNWEESYQLATNVLGVIGKRGGQKSDFANKVVKFQQETAFQAAFSMEKNKQGKEKARAWYERTISTGESSPIVLKAWHNLLASYAFPQETQPYAEKYSEFERSFKPSAEADPEKPKLLFAIYSRAASAFDVMNEPIRQAAALNRAIEQEGNTPRGEHLRRDLAALYGSYYQLASMKKEIDYLVKTGAFAKDTNFQVTMARLLFWNGDYKDAWSIVQPLVSGAQPVPVATILLGDLYSRTQKARHPVFLEIRDYLAKNVARFNSNQILQPYLAQLVQADTELAKLMNVGNEPERAPASSAGQELKARVESVGRILQALASQQQTLKRYIESPLLKASTTAVCYSPQFKLAAAKRLERLKARPVAASQWPDFVNKLNAKVQELQNLAAVDQKLCDERKQSLAYMVFATDLVSPLCDRASCYPEHPEKIDSLLLTEKELGKLSQIPKLEKVRRYLEIGAWAPAETLAYSVPSVQERSLLLGYIRVALGDYWNAAPLLREAAKDPRLANHARILLGAMASKNGQGKVAQREIASVQGGDPMLAAWEREILAAVRAGAR